MGGSALTWGPVSVPHSLSPNPPYTPPGHLGLYRIPAGGTSTTVMWHEPPPPPNLCQAPGWGGSSEPPCRGRRPHPLAAAVTKPPLPVPPSQPIPGDTGKTPRLRSIPQGGGCPRSGVPIASPPRSGAAGWGGAAWDPPLPVHPQSPPAAHLHPGLGEVDLEGQLLARVDVGVVGFGEDPLQFLQLRTGERRPDPPLLPLLVDPRRVREEFVGHWEWRGGKKGVRGGRHGGKG